jgi:hypothetical protein
MREELIRKFENILNIFPEKIIISQEILNGKTIYPFNNCGFCEIPNSNQNEESINDEIVIRENESEENSSNNNPEPMDLQYFLKEERTRISENYDICLQTKIVSINSQSFFHRKEFKRLNTSYLDQDCEKKHYIVKTKILDWKNEDFNDENNENSHSFLHVFIDTTNSEKLKEEMTLREYQKSDAIQCFA